MTTPHDDLHWFAYRYSAGELSAAEAQEFEARLEVDQAAREALAQAVALSETVCALERSGSVGSGSTAPMIIPASTARRSWLQPVGWVAAGAAACLAVVMAWQTIKVGQVEVARQEVAPPAIAKPSVVDQPGPIDDETRLLLALLDEAHARSTAAEAIGVEAIGTEPSNSERANSETTDLGAPEFELVIDEAATDEESLDDRNMTPDWLLAAVAESKS